MLDSTHPQDSEIPQGKELSQEETIKVVLSLPENQEFWKGKRYSKSRKLEEVYSRIAPGIPLVNVSFNELFLKKSEEYFEKLINEKPEIRKLERWSEYEITRMFGKGLNPTSLKTTLNNIRYFVNKLKPKDDVIKIIEYGPGSGWSTVMLFNTL